MLSLKYFTIQYKKPAIKAASFEFLLLVEADRT